MNKLLTYTILVLSISASAQTLQRAVVASMGDTQTNGNVTLSHTVGQPISGVIGESNKLSQGFQQNTIANQDINLRQGWGMLSSRVKPYNKEIDIVFEGVVNNLNIIKDNDGSVYLPEFGFNGIGDLDFKKGYQYKMVDQDIMNVRGSRVIPNLNTISLLEGWNIMSYLRKNSAALDQILADITDQIILVKDEDGAVYMPEFGFNGIGNMYSGDGYQIKTNQQVDLTYSPNNIEFRIDQTVHKEIANNTKRFSRPVNTGSNHTVLIMESAWPFNIENGDELAAYDLEGNMVGSVVLQQGHNVIAIWGDDEYTQEKEGLDQGEEFNLVIYRTEKDELQSLKVSSWERGEETYIKNGISVIESFESPILVNQKMELFQNVPNPVISSTEIGFYLPQETRAQLFITNSLGQKIIDIAKDNYQRGYHSVELSRENLASGNYYYSLKTSSKILTKQLTIIE